MQPLKLDGVSRRSFLAAGLAAFSVPAVAAEAPPTSIRVAGTFNQDAGTLWGVQNGIFQKEGLNLELQRFRSEAAIAAGLLDGSIDIGRSSLASLITEHAKGTPFVLESVASVYDAAQPTTAFVVAANSSIVSPHQLTRKTIATSTLGDFFNLASWAWIGENGGDPRSVTFLELPVALHADAVVSGRVDGALLGEPLLHEVAPLQSLRIIGYPFNAIAPRFGMTYYFCTQDYAARNKEALTRFRRAFADACSYALTHKSQMIPVLAKYLHLSQEVVAHMPFDLASGIEPAMIQPVIDFAAGYRFIPKALDAANMIDPNALGSPNV